MGIGAVGLVAKHIGSGGVGRQQDDAVTESLELTSPVMGRAASFKKEDSGRLVGAELQEGGPGESLLLAYPAWLGRHRDFESFLGHIDRDGGRFHAGLLLL